MAADEVRSFLLLLAVPSLFGPLPFPHEETRGLGRVIKQNICVGLPYVRRWGPRSTEIGFADDSSTAVRAFSCPLSDF